MNDKVRIAGAIGVGVVIIALAFQASTRNAVNQASVVLAAPPREPIETVDQNGNGTPDWEEQLTENAFKTITLPTSSTTSGEAGAYTDPTTLTGKFSVAFLQDYLQGKVNGADFSDPSGFINTAVQAIEGNTMSTKHSTGEVFPIPTTKESAHTYGNALQEIVKRHSPSTPTQNEMVILQNALGTKDPAALEALVPIAEGYARIIADTVTVPVPDIFVSQHLAILNAYEEVYADIRAAQVAFTDPLYTLARVRDYDIHAQGLLSAYILLAKELAKQGVIYTSDEPGAFYRAIENMSPTP